MGKLAMHLAMGQSPVPDSSHFSEEFDYAARVARSLARGLYKTQWNEREDPLRFKQLFGKLAPAHFPALVCARTSHNAVVAPSDELRSGSSLLGPSEHPQARGVKIAHTSFADLDPHTQTFLTEYFDLT